MFGARTPAAALASLRWFGLRRQARSLNLRCASSRPSAASTSTASAPRATIPSTSTSRGKLESTKSATGRGSPRWGRPTPIRSRRNSCEPSAAAIERRPLCPQDLRPFRLQTPEVEIDLVVNDEESVERHLEEANCRSDRASRLVHVGLRLEQRYPKTVQAEIAEEPENFERNGAP